MKTTGGIMEKRKKKKFSGYHIAKAVGEPQRLFTKQGEFTLGGDALLFLTSSGAAEYMKERRIDSVLNVIAPCECSDTARTRHVPEE